MLPMREIPASVSLLMDIEARQDEVLRQLTELDERIERVLADCSAFCRTGQCPVKQLQTLPLVPVTEQSPVALPSVVAAKVA
jgi:hypothetical protein